MKSRLFADSHLKPRLIFLWSFSIQDQSRIIFRQSVHLLKDCYRYWYWTTPLRNSASKVVGLQVHVTTHGPTHVVKIRQKYLYEGVCFRLCTWNFTKNKWLHRYFLTTVTEWLCWGTVFYTTYVCFCRTHFNGEAILRNYFLKLLGKLKDHFLSRLVDSWDTTSWSFLGLF